MAAGQWLPDLRPAWRRTMPKPALIFQPTPGLTRRSVVLVVAASLCLSCVTPVPRPEEYYNPIQQTHMGLPVDLDLLTTAKLSQDKKRVGEEFLIFFHNCETSLTDYIDALEKNLEANEELSKKYALVDSIVGGVAGLSSPAVIFATAAIAIPIAGVIWVAVGLAIQNFEIEPHIKEARKRLADARAIVQLFPDVERAFDAAVFVDSDIEAERRFKKWEVYIETLRPKVSHFFFANSAAEGR